MKYFIAMSGVAFLSGLGATLVDPGHIQSALVYVATVFGFIGLFGWLVTFVERSEPG